MRKITTRQVCQLARSFDGVTEKDHFGSDAFCANGRIFATVWHDKKRVTLMLNEEQQKSFLSRDGSEGFIQMENSWGRNAIGTDLETIDPDIFREALHAAWLNSANKRVTRKTGSRTKKTGSSNLRRSRK